MATQTTRTPPSSANPSAQPSSRSRDWNKPRHGEPGSAFVPLRGRGARGRGGRGGGRPPSSPAIREGKLPHSEPSKSDISTPPKAELPSLRKGPARSVSASATSEKPPLNSADRTPKPKTPSRRASRNVPAVTVAPASPTPDSVPSTPSRNVNRRRRSQPHTKPPSNGATKPSIPLSTSLRPQKPAIGSTSSDIAPRKDVPPHLIAAHEAEIRHGIDAMVERVRAVAMAENRPSTPGSHIDWAGEEDDSLPDLDDWGVTTTLTSTFDKEEEISPILADALKPLPEPQTEGDAEDEEEQHMAPLDDDDDGGVNQDSLEPSPLSNAPDIQDMPATMTADVHETPVVTTAPETIHLPLSGKPVTAMESPRAHSAPSNLPPKPASTSGREEPLATKKDGLSQSIHAPSPAEGEAPERTLSSSFNENGLAASIHAPGNLVVSHSAPSLLIPGAPPSARTFSPSHGRSKTECRGAFPHSRTTPPTAVNQRGIRSGTSSPLGPHTPTHGRNHSTPPGGAGQRAPHSARPVLTGEAISRLARTIGGMPVIPRAQGVVAVAKD